MLLPYNTDAPIYHFPYVTIGLIVVNALVFGFTAQADAEQVVPWILIFGDGLHPLQWVTTNFLHGGFMHLFGNMFYLWGFGLVVEGKLGAWRMLAVYLAIGVVYGAIIQVAMLSSTGGALGASGVIFGLMAMALVWAPRNEISCFAWYGIPTTFDVSIVMFAATYVVWQVVLAALSGFAMSSEMLHLTGALLGAVAGVALLKWNVVDCEGWDVFAVWRGTEGQNQQSRVRLADRPVAAAIEAARPANPSTFNVDFSNRLASGDVAGAATAYAAHRRAHPAWRLSEAELLTLIQALHQQRLWSDSIAPMVDYLRQFPERAARMRLKLGQILVVHEKRPVKALEVLGRVNLSELPPELREAHGKLVARAEAIREECELEIADEEEW